MTGPLLIAAGLGIFALLSFGPTIVQELMKPKTTLPDGADVCLKIVPGSPRFSISLNDVIPILRDAALIFFTAFAADLSGSADYIKNADWHSLWVLAQTAALSGLAALAKKYFSNSSGVFRVDNAATAKATEQAAAIPALKDVAPVQPAGVADVQIILKPGSELKL